MNQQLQQLLSQAHALLDQAIDHPEYAQLVAQGFNPESTVFNAQSSIVFLQLSIKKFIAQERP